MDYQIITDSAWDLGPDSARALDVDVVPLYVSTDDKMFLQEGTELPVRSIYEFMVKNPGVFPKTSLPTIEDYKNTFLKYANMGKDIICFTISKKFSGSYNSAVKAKEIVQKSFGKIRVEIVDSVQATVMQGAIVQEVAKARIAGVTYDQALKIAERIKPIGKIFFTVSNLDYLIHGGRVGKAAGLAGNFLKISPLIYMYRGELDKAGLARGRENAKQKLIRDFFKYVESLGKDPDQYSYVVGYGYDRQEGEDLKRLLSDKIKERWSGFSPQIECYQIGAAIGVHTGPYPIGFGVVEKWDSES